MIDHYRCLPSQLDREDVARLLRDRTALAIFRAVSKPHTRWTTAEEKLIVPLMELDWKRKHG